MSGFTGSPVMGGAATRGTVPWTRYAAALATFIVLTFALAVVWHVLLFAETYAWLGGYTRTEPLVPLGLGSVVLEGIAFVYIYRRASSGRRPWRDGAAIGFAMGLFMGAYAALAVAGHSVVASVPLWVAVEGASFLIQFTLVGMAVGAVLDRPTD